MSQSSERTRLATVMYVRGFSVLALGATGIRWPQRGLWIAIAVAGCVVTLLGMVELALALRSTADRSVRARLIYVALVSIGFGVVSLALQFASPAIAIATLTTWLLGHATVSLMVGSAMSRAPDRHVLFAWSTVNLIAAMVVAVASVPVFQEILYAGAAYTGLYGAMQITSALRLRAAAVSSPGPAPRAWSSAIPRSRSR